MSSHSWAKASLNEFYIFQSIINVTHWSFGLFSSSHRSFVWPRRLLIVRAQQSIYFSPYLIMHPVYVANPVQVQRVSYNVRNPKPSIKTNTTILEKLVNVCYDIFMSLNAEFKDNTTVVSQRLINKHVSIWRLFTLPWFLWYSSGCVRRNRLTPQYPSLPLWLGSRGMRSSLSNARALRGILLWELGACPVNCK